MSVRVRRLSMRNGLGPTQQSLEAPPRRPICAATGQPHEGPLCARCEELQVWFEAQRADPLVQETSRAMLAAGLAYEAALQRGAPEAERAELAQAFGDAIDAAVRARAGSTPRAPAAVR